MKTKLKILAVATMFFAADLITAQEVVVKEENEPKRERKIRPVRIGGKIGFPNLIGGNLEYVTPLLNKKLSGSFDYSVFKSGLTISEGGGGYSDGVENEGSASLNLDFNYIEGGLNYYFFKPGRGLYGGVGYGVLKFNGTGSYTANADGFERTGTRTVDFSHSSFNVKLGAKLGGLFYFRPEVGYSFNSLPEFYEMNVVFDDGSSETQIEDNPVARYIPSGLIANIGIGFAF